MRESVDGHSGLQYVRIARGVKYTQIWIHLVVREVFGDRAQLTSAML